MSSRRRTCQGHDPRRFAARPSKEPEALAKEEPARMLQAHWTVRRKRRGRGRRESPKAVNPDRQRLSPAPIAIPDARGQAAAAVRAVPISPEARNNGLPLHYATRIG